jgi:hypothetical protein
MRHLILCALVASAAGACVYDWSVPASDGGAAGSGAGVGGAAGQAGGGAPGDGGGGDGGMAGAAGAGGAPAVCAPDGADDVCTACLKAQCCDQLVACEGDLTCECWADCIPTGADCTHCGKPFGPSGALLLCVTNCDVECL